MYSQEYQLVWSEEFNSSEINPEIWNFEKGFSKNNEQQFYTSRPQNARIENGKLILEARKEKYGEEADYTSARLNTLGKKDFRYGKIEVRAKLPKGAGTWPAIWMLGSNEPEVGFPACGEIDIMEFIGKSSDEIYGSVHYPENEDDNLISATEEAKLPATNDGYHTFSVEWDGAHISYFVGDRKFFTFSVDDANRSGRKNPFRKPFYLILNLALGGKWAGEIEDTHLPACFYVDYVRYYQLKN